MSEYAHDQMTEGQVVEEQADFRVERGCRAQIFVMRQMAEKTLRRMVKCILHLLTRKRLMTKAGEKICGERLLSMEWQVRK